MQTPAYVHNPALHDSVEALEESICHHVRYSLAKAWQSLTKRDLFVAVALAVRDRMVDRMFETAARYRKADAKRLYYLSMEFLIGRLLGTNLQNLGLLEVCQETLLRMGVDLEELRESESDPALGNGGLGRLAACFLDSLATLGMPAMAMASTTITVCSGRKLTTAFRKNVRTSGVRTGQHGRLSARMRRASSQSMAVSITARDRAGSIGAWWSVSPLTFPLLAMGGRP
jgi:hypothetical protein